MTFEMLKDNVSDNEEVGDKFVTVIIWSLKFTVHDIEGDIKEEQILAAID